LIYDNTPSHLRALMRNNDNKEAPFTVTETMASHQAHGWRQRQSYG